MLYQQNDDAMIKYVAVDPVIWEKAKANHLALLRLTFDKAKSKAHQYDVVSMAREFYGNEDAIIQMENELQYSDKPKF